MSNEANKSIRFTEVGTATAINLASPDDKGARRFSMLAYSGGEVLTWGGRMVVDLASMNVGTKRKPMLLNHDASLIAGYSEDVKIDQDGISFSGKLSRTTAAGKEVAELADEGFPWQASIGFNYGVMEGIGEGKSVTVNGREFAGPIMVARGAKLKESSFVPLGADSDTSAAVFADGSPIEWPNTKKDSSMSKDNEKTVDAAAVADASFKEGYATAKSDLSAFLNAFPTDAVFAVQQFNSGKSLIEAKLAKAELATAELAAVTAKLADAEKKLALSQGGQAAVGAPAPAVTDEPSDPKAKAEWEWTNDPTLSQRFSNKDRYVSYRVAVLNGRIFVK
jgi:phage head maturation protease